MVYPCRGNSSKVYSSISSRNKHEKKKGHCSEKNTDPDVSFNEETQLCHCLTGGCATTAKYKYNIVSHVILSTSVGKEQLITKFAKLVERFLRKSQTEIDIFNSFIRKLIMMLEKMNYHQW